MKTGTVKFFKKEKGYGFIVSDEDKKDLFVHVNACEEEIKAGDRVTFEESKNRKGDMAINVKMLS